jgi:hypothetical protein
MTIACWYFAETGHHWYVLKPQRCGPAMKVCLHCGERSAV